MLLFRNPNVDGGHSPNHTEKDETEELTEPVYDSVGRVVGFVPKKENEPRGWRSFFHLNKKPKQDYRSATGPDMAKDADVAQPAPMPEVPVPHPSPARTEEPVVVKDKERRRKKKLEKKSAKQEKNIPPVVVENPTSLPEQAPEPEAAKIPEPVLELAPEEAKELANIATREITNTCLELVVHSPSISTEDKLALAEPSAQEKLKEQIAKKSFFSRPAVHGLVEFVGGMAAGATYKSLATGGLKKAIKYAGVAHGASSWASLGISAGIGAAVGASWEGGRVYLQERKRVKAEQQKYEEELKGKVGTERLELLLKYRTRDDMENLDPAAREILGKYDKAKVSGKKIGWALFRGACIGGLGGVAGNLLADKFFHAPGDVHAAGPEATPPAEVPHVTSHTETIVPNDLTYEVKAGDTSVWKDITTEHLHKAGIANPSDKLINEVTRKVLENQVEITSDHAANLSSHAHFDGIKDIHLKVGDQIHHWEVANDLIRQAGGHPENFNLTVEVPDAHVHAPEVDMKEAEGLGYNAWRNIALGLVATGGAAAYALYGRGKAEQENKPEKTISAEYVGNGSLPPPSSVVLEASYKKEPETGVFNIAPVSTDTDQSRVFQADSSGVASEIRVFSMGPGEEAAQDTTEANQAEKTAQEQLAKAGYLLTEAETALQEEKDDLVGERLQDVWKILLQKDKLLADLDQDSKKVFTREFEKMWAGALAIDKIMQQFPVEEGAKAQETEPPAASAVKPNILFEAKDQPAVVHVANVEPRVANVHIGMSGSGLPPVDNRTPEVTREAELHNNISAELDGLLTRWSDYVYNSFERELQAARATGDFDYFDEVIKKQESMWPAVWESEEWQKTHGADASLAVGIAQEWDTNHEERITEVAKEAKIIAEKFKSWRETKRPVTPAVVELPDVPERLDDSKNPDIIFLNDGFDLLTGSIDLLSQPRERDTEIRLIVDGLKNMRENYAGNSLVSELFEQRRQKFFEDLEATGEGALAREIWSQVGEGEYYGDRVRTAEPEPTVLAAEPPASAVEVETPHISIQDQGSASEKPKKAPRGRIQADIISNAKERNVDLRNVNSKKYAETLVDRDKGGQLWSAVDGEQLSQEQALEIQGHLKAVRSFDEMSEADRNAIESMLQILQQADRTKPQVKQLINQITGIHDSIKELATEMGL